MRNGESNRNRITGETITMLLGENETDGIRQLYQVSLPPRRPSPPVHYHLAFTETFSALEGKLDLYLGRERKHLFWARAKAQRLVFESCTRLPTNGIGRRLSQSTRDPPAG